MGTTDKYYIGERLEALLIENNIGRLDFAKKLGCGRKSVDDWCGCIQNPALGTIIKIADIFGVSLDWLITGEEFNGKRR